MFGVDENAIEVMQMMQGHCAIVAALVIALDECGVVPKRRYSEVLHRLWREMPEEEAVGEAGAVIERVLEVLGASVNSGCPSHDAEKRQEFCTSASKPANDAYARFVLTSQKALLQD